MLGWGGPVGAAAPRDGKQDLTPTARDLSDRGLRQYQNGELDAAIESFMGAFALSDNTGLLFNVAQAYRLKGDCALAKEYYRRYLDSAPESNLRPSVERRLAEMDSCVKTSATAGGAEPQLPVTALATVTPPKEPGPLLATASPSSAPPDGPRNRAAVWMLRGSAAALLATSAVFAVLAWDAKTDFDDTSIQREATEAKERFKLDATLAVSFAVVGVACAAASYFVGRR
jgi:hypothetical protein